MHPKQCHGSFRALKDLLIIILFSGDKNATSHSHIIFFFLFFFFGTLSSNITWPITQVINTRPAST